jgi:transposase
MEISTIGLDLAKNVFQVHGIDSGGNVVVRRALRRKDVLPFFGRLAPCLVGIEACGSSHHWAREIASCGHDVRLMPPAYVKPYVKRNKNDMADAEAICEAVTRPSMRFVPVKTAEQQSVLMLHRARSLLVRQRTMLANAIRGHLAELGIAVPQGFVSLFRTLDRMLETTPEREPLPPLVCTALKPLLVSLRELSTRIKALELELMKWHRASETSRRLETIPGFGFVTATAITASIPDPSVFSSGRQFAAWLGLTPRQNSSGGKERLGRITKMGNSYLRMLLVVGATSVLRFARGDGALKNAWAKELLAKKPPRVVAVALANKMARIAWAVMTNKESYRVVGA